MYVPPLFWFVRLKRSVWTYRMSFLKRKKKHIQGTTLDFLNMHERGIKHIEVKVIPFKSQNFKSGRFRPTPLPSPPHRHP